MIRGQLRGCLPSHMTRRIVSEPSQWEKLVWRLHMTESEAIEAIRSGKCKMLIQWSPYQWVLKESRESRSCTCSALHVLHFCRVHKTLRVTPAMEAGISDHVWEIAELVKLMEPKSILEGLSTAV